MGMEVAVSLYFSCFILNGHGYIQGCSSFQDFSCKNDNVAKIKNGNLATKVLPASKASC